jgi:hypothetical protein
MWKEADVAWNLSAWLEENHENIDRDEQSQGRDLNPVFPEYTKCVLMSSKKAGQKHGIKLPNGSFDAVTKFKYLRTTLTDINFMQGRD